MISDGILFTGSERQDRRRRTTAAIKAERHADADRPAERRRRAHRHLRRLRRARPARRSRRPTPTASSSWSQQGKATLEVHPIAILDRSSHGTQLLDRARTTPPRASPTSPRTASSTVHDRRCTSKQPAEQTAGSDEQPDRQRRAQRRARRTRDVDKCINGRDLQVWVTVRDARALDDRPAAEHSTRRRSAARRRCWSTASSSARHDGASARRRRRRSPQLRAARSWPG